MGVLLVITVICYIILAVNQLKKHHVKPHQNGQENFVNQNYNQYNQQNNYCGQSQPNFYRPNNYNPNNYNHFQNNNNSCNNYNNNNTVTSGGFQEPPIYPYQSKRLLTNAEQKFYYRLRDRCIPNNILICPKVRLEDFINVTQKQNQMKFRGYIRARHVDFMLCDMNMTILAAIELDDYSHNGSEAKKIDEFKNKLFFTISIPLYRVTAAIPDPVLNDIIQCVASSRRAGMM